MLRFSGGVIGIVVVVIWGLRWICLDGWDGWLREWLVGGAAARLGCFGDA